MHAPRTPVGVTIVGVTVVEVTVVGVAVGGVHGGPAVIDQLWGPVVNLVGDGGYHAWTVGTWLVVKGANLVVYAVIAVVFVAGMLINIPEHRQDTHEDTHERTHEDLP